MSRLILCGADPRDFEGHEPELSTQGKTGYESVHELRDVRECLSGCNYTVRPESVVINGCTINGSTEEEFWRAICVSEAA